MVELQSLNFELMLISQNSKLNIHTSKSSTFYTTITDTTITD